MISASLLVRHMEIHGMLQSIQITSSPARIPRWLLSHAEWWTKPGIEHLLCRIASSGKLDR